MHNAAELPASDSRFRLVAAVGERLANRYYRPEPDVHASRRMRLLNQSFYQFSELQVPIHLSANEPVTLVLLPGMDGTGLLFEPFIKALGERYALAVVAGASNGYWPTT